MRSATWCAHFVGRVARFWEHDCGYLAWLRSILTKIMTFIPFERLFDRINGGSIYLGTTLGDCAYNKSRQHLLNQERIFLGHNFVIFCQNILYRKRPRSVWPRCDAILRVAGRSDMH